MTRSLFSSSWHSVADLRPRLVPQSRIHRHVYRGQVWYVVQDQTGGRHHRLSPAAYGLLLGMDGGTTVQQLWEKANQSGSGDACTQNEIVDLLVQLHAADLLQADGQPDSAVLFERYRKKRRASLKQFLLNPMSLKLPLLDPDPFLARWAPCLAWCFTRGGGLAWLAWVLPALVLAGQHWSELTRNLSEQVLSSSNLLVMALVFPLVKLLHELGHAFACRVWGGAVHEMGVMFLVFAPVPYINVSASAVFPSKWRRATVAAAGMLVELVLAALALYVWLLVEPGIVRALAYNVMVVAGVSTLIVNGNPLLRYDAYYILADLIEMPNLAQRGQKYLAWLWDRHAFGAHDLDEPQEGRGERRWLLAYTPLAWAYRVFVTVSIMLFVAGQFFIFGVLIAFWGLVSLIGLPLWKAWRHVARSVGPGSPLRSGRECGPFGGGAPAPRSFRSLVLRVARFGATLDLSVYPRTRPEGPPIRGPLRSQPRQNRDANQDLAARRRGMWSGPSGAVRPEIGPFGGGAAAARYLRGLVPSVRTYRLSSTTCK